MGAGESRAVVAAVGRGGGADPVGTCRRLFVAATMMKQDAWRRRRPGQAVSGEEEDEEKDEEKDEEDEDEEEEVLVKGAQVEEPPGP